MANEERSGKRDMLMSSIHRILGAGLMMSDLDCVEISGGPVALIEWKCGLETPYATWQKKAMRHLADCAKIPFYVIRRNDAGNTFAIEALNEYDGIIKNMIARGDKENLYYVQGMQIVCNIRVLRAFIIVLHGKNPKLCDIEDREFSAGPFAGKTYKQVFSDLCVDVNRIDLTDAGSIDMSDLI
jgi:hypothetical protein